MKIACMNDDIRIAIEDNDPPDLLLKVKCLKGRVFLGEDWSVRYYPGLADDIENILEAPQGAATVKIYEDRYLASLDPDPVYDPNSITADDAIAQAVTAHLIKYHHGDIDDYNRVHFPFRIGR